MTFAIIVSDIMNKRNDDVFRWQYSKQLLTLMMRL